MNDVSDEQLWSELPDTSGSRRAEVLLELADRSYQRNDLQQFQTLVDAATSAAEESGDDRLSAFARYNQGQGQFESGCFDEAAESFLLAASYFHVVGEHGDVAQSHMRAAEALSNLCQPERALEHWQTALALYRSDSDHLNAGRAWMLIGGEQMVLHQIADAEESFLAARGEFRSAKSAVHVAWADDAAAEALINQGRPHEALPLLRSCLDVAQVGSDTAGTAYAHLRLGAVLRMTGGLAESLLQLDRAREFYRECDDLLGIARSDLERGHTLRDQHQTAEALGCYQQARSVFDAVAADSYVHFVDRSRTELLLDTRQFAEAEIAARDVLRAAQDSGDKRSIEEAVMLVAAALLGLDQPEAALSVVTTNLGGNPEPSDELVVAHLVTWARILAATGQVEEASTLADALLTNPRVHADFRAAAGLHELRWHVDPSGAQARHHLTHAIALYVASGDQAQAQHLSENLTTTRSNPPVEIDLRATSTRTSAVGAAPVPPSAS